MFCEKCGTPNDDGNSVCTNCGQPIGGEQPPAGQPAPQYEQQPYQAQQQSYQQPYEQAYQPYNQQNAPYPATPYMEMQRDAVEHMTMGDWLKRMCIPLIPCVGPIIYIVMLFVWAFGSTPKKSLKTYAQAQLIFAAIIFALYIILAVVFATAGYSFFNEISNSLNYY